MWQDAASSSPPPTTAPCSTAITGTRPNWIASKAACQPRECRIAAWMSRSTSSERSSPAQKCAPSPLTTTARTSAGRLTKAVCSCAIRPSLIALRLTGRFRRMCSTAPSWLICSSSRPASRPVAGVKVESGAGVLMSGRRWGDPGRLTGTLQALMLRKYKYLAVPWISMKTLDLPLSLVSWCVFAGKPLV